VWLLPAHGESDPSIAGAPRRITEPVRAWAACHDIVWSQDGNRLALNIVELSTDGNYIRSLYVVRSATGELKRISLDLNLPALSLHHPRLSLSPDGNLLAYSNTTSQEDSAHLSIYMVPTSGGTPRQLTQQATAEPSFSPDGKRVAYLGLVGDKEWRPTSLRGREIWIVPVFGGTPALLYKLPGPGRIHGQKWSADGKTIGFLLNHDNRGDPCDEMMLLPVNDEGHPSASPTVIKLPQTTWHKLAGWSPDNRIALVINSPEVTALYSVPASGGKAVQLTAKWATMPSWTPDGKRIYFMGTHQNRQEESASIEYVPAEGGEVTRIPVRGPHPITPTYPGGELSISPDGKKILFSGRFYSVDDLLHMFIIPIEGGEVTEIATGIKWSFYPRWAPDGKSFAFFGIRELEGGKRLNDIYTMSASGGKAQKLTSDSDQVSYGPVAWAPDGKHIAYYSEDNKLKLVPAEGGPSRVLVVGLKGYISDSGLSWSPDGRELAYITHDKIFRLNLESGKSEEVPTGLPDAHLMQMAWSPDGKTIAFSALQGGDPELWLMEDFLPSRQARR
jgi:Tol biopolymer transport system component